jgi:cyclohexanone monooxygenase
MTDETVLDALIVGAGFAGIYQLYALKQLGLSAQVIDRASDVGGTWFWNKYPGAMSDVESYVYRFSWDKDDLLTYPWDEHYVKQPDVYAYLKHVVKRHDLGKHMKFNQEVQAAIFDEVSSTWRIETGTGDTFIARFLITGLGVLSRINYPDIQGIDSFQGERYHTGAWPESHDFTSKRVAVIGNGSTGVQVITQLGKEKKFQQLVSFQRHPQYSVPAGDGPVSKEYRDGVNVSYDKIWDHVRKSKYGFGFDESKIPAMSVSESERQRIFQKAWDKGNGFRFMFWTFDDITINPDANDAACSFIRQKIKETVKDPEKCRKLTPHDYYARRPICDTGYYETFNQENVDIINIKENPIECITPKGIRTSDGIEHKFDVIIFATGFDAVDGNYTTIRIQGRGGKLLASHWENGPTSYLGIGVAKFPNLFMICGPKGPFTNIPATIEAEVELITALIQHAGDALVIESTQEAEDQWCKLCDDVAAESLFVKTESWIFGANVPGKKRALLFYFGGLANYRELAANCVRNGFSGFKSTAVNKTDKVMGSLLRSPFIANSPAESAATV